MSDFSPFGWGVLRLKDMPGWNILNGHRCPHSLWEMMTLRIMTRRWPSRSKFELISVFHIWCRCDRIKDYGWIGSGCGIFAYLRWDGYSRWCTGCSREFSAPLNADIYYTTLVPIDLMDWFIGVCGMLGKGAWLLRLDASFTFVGCCIKNALLLCLATCRARHLMECKQMQTKRSEQIIRKLNL